ncbi:MAG: Cobalamin-independent synthase, Catalytic domain, partial [Gaiellaceae bacterium]|nr:Cobalamin-independent synthase, Catalytic domain [Gaiellaceae bacterium]
APKRPFRADHIGSLLRPASLLEARRQHDKGELGAAALRAVGEAAA